MTLDDLLILLRYYDTRFCFSIRSQLRDVTSGECLEDCNPNALKEILDFLKKAQTHGVEDCEGTIDELTEHLQQQK